jgi:hypothetical protein
LTLGLALAATVTLARQPPDLIKTVPERTNYTETSRYTDVVTFLEAVAKASPRVHLTTFGTTNERRALPLAVIGAAAAAPDAVRQTGKLRVYIQANIHGGEVEGKESAQMLVRDLAAGRHDDWLETMVLLIAPIYNADGNERVALDNRGPQNGPAGGQGQRYNAQGLDLNRDHMKLDSPEARAFVQLLNDYDPHVTMDLHTTNGTRHAYMLTYAPPLHPGTDSAIVELLRKEWLPAVTKIIREKHGWDYYYYGNVSGGRRNAPSTAPPGGPADSGQRRWATFDHRPRFNNNYVGLRNRVAVLSEAYAYASFQDRILATSRFVDENLAFAHANTERIVKLTDSADRRSLVGARLPLRAELQHSGTIDILMGEVAEEKHPVDGHVVHVRKDVRTAERMADFSTFGALELERVPATYYLPPGLTEAVERLSAHGIAMTAVTSVSRVAVEEFRIDGVQTAAKPFQNRSERSLHGAWTQALRDIPPGTIAVSMTQPRARLAFYLIEPRSDDGLANWDLLGDVLRDATVYPIVRSRK